MSTKDWFNRALPGEDSSRSTLPCPAREAPLCSMVWVWPVRRTFSILLMGRNLVVWVRWSGLKARPAQASGALGSHTICISCDLIGTDVKRFFMTVLFCLSRNSLRQSSLYVLGLHWPS